MALSVGLSWGCGPQKSVHTIERPTLQHIEESSEDSKSPGMGADAPPGFLRPCQTIVAGGGLVELSCAEHQIVEFRRAASAGPDAMDQDMDELMKILSDRFGELEDLRDSGNIDGNPIGISRVKSGGKKFSGIAVIVQNKQGRFWGLVCYRKGEEYSEDFCGAAIATAARAGGLGLAEARKSRLLGAGEVKVPKDCHSQGGQKVVCPGGELRWTSAGEKSPELLKEEVLGNLRKMAQGGGVHIVEKESSCALFGKKAECGWAVVRSTGGADVLSFVLLRGGGQDGLVVCSFPEVPSTKLPRPCSQAIEFPENTWESEN